MKFGVFQQSQNCFRTDGVNKKNIMGKEKRGTRLTTCRVEYGESLSISEYFTNIHLKGTRLQHNNKYLYSFDRCYHTLSMKWFVDKIPSIGFWVDYRSVIYFTVRVIHLINMICSGSLEIVSRQVMFKS